jgi:serine phosphatase RsbU (regulator of sigma subunit)
MELNHKQGEANVLCNIGPLMVLNEDYENAIQYYEESNRIYEELGDIKGIAIINHNIGDIYKRKGYFSRSIDYFNKAIDMAKKIDFLALSENAYENLYEGYLEKGQYRKALDNYNLFIKIRDSINNIEHKSELIEQEVKHNYEKKAFVDSVEFAKEQDKKNLEIENKSTQRNILIVGFLLLSIAMVIIFREYVQNKKSNKIIQSQKEKLEEANIELDTLNQSLASKNYELSEIIQRQTDSIMYASKIQSAVLPSNERMRLLLNSYIVVYLPRDIVSGDFYWIEKIDGKTFIIVADCTGHGVPGAFMSMIGNEMLNNIIIKQRIFDPARVLEEMHKDVRYALKQDETIESSHDGMDVCMCVIDNKKLTFAGAKRPLYYVQNNEFYEIKGDRKSIGGRQKEEERTFTNHSIDLTTETMLYMSTDGYQDQHNTKQEKFGVKRFRDLLHSIADKPMEEQKDILEKTLAEFSEGEKNRDDVAVLGVKIKL